MMISILLCICVLAAVMAALPKHQLDALKNGEGVDHDGRIYTRADIAELRDKGLVPKGFMNDDPEPAPAAPDPELLNRAETAEAEAKSLKKERDALQKQVDSLTAENDKLKAAAKGQEGK